MDNLDFTNLFFDDDEFVVDRPSIDEESITFGGGKYTSKVQAPHYIPSGPCPSISEFVDTRKYEELIQKINASNVSDDNKRFLRLAAARHIVFNFLDYFPDYFLDNFLEVLVFLGEFQY